MASGGDFSVHNSDLNFAVLKRELEFAWFKTSEGEDFDDDQAARNAAGFDRHDIPCGGYHYLRPKNNRRGRDEMDDFAARLRRYDLGEGDLKPVIDIEDRPLALALGAARVTEYAQDAVDELKRRGYSPLIYTYPSFAEEFLRSDLGCDLWIAHYTEASQPSVPKPWKDKGWVVWQYWAPQSASATSYDKNRCPHLSKITAGGEADDEGQPHRELQDGDEGRDVYLLQRAINRRARRCGRPDHTVDADGEYGENTKRHGAFVAWVLGIGAGTQADLVEGGISTDIQRWIRQPGTRNDTQRERAVKRRAEYCRDS